MEEGKKRKKNPEGNDAVTRTRKKAQEERGGAQQPGIEVAKDEVEEFFAILRRIHMAVSYFEKQAERDGRQSTRSGSWLRQTIERECAGVANGVRERVEENVNVGFDLNADPDPE